MILFGAQATGQRCNTKAAQNGAVDDPPGAVPVQPLTVDGQEDRPFGAVPRRQRRGPRAADRD